MFVVGLCGGSGSGKSIASGILRKLGVATLDADRIYSDLISVPGQCNDAIAAEFGSSVLNSDGSLNKSALRAIVFADGAEDKRKKLNSISHLFVLSVINDQLAKLENEGVDIAFVDMPLLFECGYDKCCNMTVSVIADRETRIKRLMLRDGLDRNSVERRINSQISDAVLASLTDRVLKNDSTEAELEASVVSLLDEIKNIIRGE